MGLLMGMYKALSDWGSPLTRPLAHRVCLVTGCAALKFGVRPLSLLCNWKERRTPCGRAYALQDLRPLAECPPHISPPQFPTRRPGYRRPGYRRPGHRRLGHRRPPHSLPHASIAPRTLTPDGLVWASTSRGHVMRSRMILTEIALARYTAMPYNTHDDVRQCRIVGRLRRYTKGR